MTEPLTTEPFKVAVAGPSRVGKTTLLTAVLSDTEDMLASTPVSVVPEGRTAARIRQQKLQLRRAIEAEEFDAAALGGTQSVSRYEVMLKPDGEFGIEIPFRILDYPGRWLNPDLRQKDPEAVQYWPQFEEHIKNSIMLLLPIDAAVLMEAATPPQRSAMSDLLGLVDVHELARKWAKARSQRATEPAVVVLAPIKCEKYFSKTYVWQNSGRLSAKVREKYGDILTTIRKEAGNSDLRIAYVPIDTYGCVQLMETEWPDLGPNGPGHLEFIGHYRFLGRPPKIQVQGAGVIMQELCRCIVTRQVSEEQSSINAAQMAHGKLLDRKTEDKGFWGTLGYYLGGEAWENRTGRQQTQHEIAGHLRQREQLASALQKIVEAEPEPGQGRLDLW